MLQQLPHHSHKNPQYADICGEAGHKLELCKDCDIVYCSKCQKEWQSIGRPEMPDLSGLNKHFV